MLVKKEIDTVQGCRMHGILDNPQHIRWKQRG